MTSVIFLFLFFSFNALRMWNRFYPKVPINLIDSQWHGSKPTSFLNQNIMYDMEACNFRNGQTLVSEHSNITVPSPYTLPLQTVPDPFVPSSPLVGTLDIYVMDT